MRVIVRIAVVCSLCACAAAGSAGGDLRSVRAQEPSLEEIYDLVHTSVVTIHTLGRTGPVGAEGEAATEQGVGSGVLISDDGRILTAAHVVQTADAVTVEFNDGTRQGAHVVGSVIGADVALIQLDERPPAGIRIARLGDSSRVRIASRTFVVGAPLGISHTLTVGHVSARRLRPAFGGVGDIEILQTDAAVNRGNSGGPLFDMNGEVIGIVSYIVSQSGGSEGLGFAISSNTAKRLLLDRNAMWTGTSHVILTGAYAEAFNVPKGRLGLLIQQVAKDSPGDRLGIRGGTIAGTVDDQPILLGGDIVIECFGIPLEDETSVEKVLKRAETLEPGKTLSVRVLRAGEVVELAEKVEVLMPWLVQGK